MKLSNFEIQVSKEHYFKEYTTKKRWICYWHQIDEVLKTKPKKILEIGIGNKTVSDYLKNQNIKITTVDIDKNLKPDYVCSVTDLSKYLKEKSFDTVLCAEVLEHLPFEYFEKSLKEIKRVTKNYAIISLPYVCINFRFSFKFPLFKQKKIFIQMPLYKKHEFDGEHYWEIGKKKYPLNKIKKIIQKYFLIEKNYLVWEHPYNMFFILKVKK